MFLFVDHSFSDLLVVSTSFVSFFFFFLPLSFSLQYVLFICFPVSMRGIITGSTTHLPTIQAAHYTGNVTCSPSVG